MHILPRWRKTAEKMLSGREKKVTSTSLPSRWESFGSVSRTQVPARAGLASFLHLGILPELHNVGGPEVFPWGLFYRGLS